MNALQTRTSHQKTTSHKPATSVEFVRENLSTLDLEDLCDSTEDGIRHGGGFGWTEIPPRESMERFWQGVITAPTRWLFVARLDGAVCGSAQLILPPPNNEAQAHIVHLTTNFIAPWARGYGLARDLLAEVERKALKEGYKVINLDVRDTQQAAIKLYESAGFIHCGVHPYYAKVDGRVVKGHNYYKVIDEQAFEQQR